MTKCLYNKKYKITVLVKEAVSMSSKLVSLKYKKMEKQYKDFYSNYTYRAMSLSMVGSPPQSPVEIKKQLKTS